MDKSTLSGYGWIIIVTLILAVMLALATPFGTYVGDGVVAVANSFVKSADNAMDEDNIDTMKSQWEGKFDYETLQNQNNALNPGDTIPEGMTYYQNTNINYAIIGNQIHAYIYAELDKATVYSAGDKFPQPKSGDVCYYNGIDYIYGYRASTGGPVISSGWSVGGIWNTGESEILESINGQKVNTLSYLCTVETMSKLFIPANITMISFYNNCTITEIVYAGTIAQWNQIDLDTYAMGTYVQITKISCSDGDIIL